jgi:hypothetical protein
MPRGNTAIVQYAEEENFDPMVTGSGSGEGVSRLEIASVAAALSGRDPRTAMLAR